MEFNDAKEKKYGLLDPSLILNHKVIKRSVKKNMTVIAISNAFVEYFKKIQYADMPNIARKIATIQYLHYLQKNKGLQFVYLIEMAYELEHGHLRSRSLKSGKPVLMMGRDPKNTLPADETFKFEDSICFQVHHYTLKDTEWNSSKDFYSFSVYYPKDLSNSYISVENDYDDYDEDYDDE